MPRIALRTGITMNYEEWGSNDGEPVILSYGAAGDHRPWLPQVDALSRHYRLITPDTRGTGLTDCVAEDWSIQTFAEDLVALMDSLGVESAHIGGMSMGSAIAQVVGVRFPKKVKSLLLCNTWGRTDARLRLIWQHMLFLLDAHDNASDRALKERIDDSIFDLSTFMFFSPDAISNRMPMVRDWWSLYQAGVRPETGRGHWHAILGHDALDSLSEISCPTLVLAGEEDYFTPYYPRQVHGRIPNSELVLLEGPGSSHGLLWEREVEANSILLRFLHSVSR